MREFNAEEYLQFVKPVNKPEEKNTDYVSPFPPNSPEWIKDVEDHKLVVDNYIVVGREK